MREDGFEAREAIGDLYWDDPRWKEVEELRESGKDLEANNLVFTIRESYGLE